MKDVYLISCTKSKKQYTCKAEEMYLPSPKFRASLEYAENRVTNREEQIFIISAKYGLLALNDLIDTYDESLIGKTLEECDAWGDRISKALECIFDFRETNFVILAGYSYTRPLIGKLKNITTPLAGKTMGVSISWLQHNKVPGQKDEKENKAAKPIKPICPANPCLETSGSDTAGKYIPKWEALLEILRDATELQTINWQGIPNLWFSAKSCGKEILIGPAKRNKPSSKASPRALTKREYEDLSELYFPWREKRVRRGDMVNISLNSSYAFALMNHFGIATKESTKQMLNYKTTPKEIPIRKCLITPIDVTNVPRILVPAKHLRNKEYLDNVPGDKPGWYRWWAPKEAVEEVLNSPHLEEKWFDVIFPHMTGGKGKLENYYCLYVGVAINESIRARLDWHINQTHTKGNVYHGSLSTLRQTISSLLTADQSSETETNHFIDMLQVEFQAMPLPIKSADAKRHIETIENAEIKKILYPLNIKDNNHEIIRPFRSQLSGLRTLSKEKALETGFMGPNPKVEIERLRGVTSEVFVREALERQKWLKYNYLDYLGEEPMNVELQLRKTPNADFELCCVLLTLLLREEHFCMGTFSKRVQEGSVNTILDRMLEVL